VRFFLAAPAAFFMLRRAAAVWLAEVTSAISFPRRGCFSRGARTIRFRSPLGRRTRLTREGATRGRRTRLALERFFHRARSPARGLFCARGSTFSQVALCLFACARRSLSPFWRRQFHTGATRLRETNSDRLFGRARAMFAFADVLHLFAHKFARLGRGRFAFALVFAGPF
jgi:hypothetical protein